MGVTVRCSPVMRFLPILALLAFAPASATAPLPQTTRILVDLGTSQYPSAGAPGDAWNDVDETNLGAALQLVDTTGAPSGVTWDWPAVTFDNVNSAGTAAPAPGSDLAAFPVSVTRDVAYGSNQKTVTLRLAGLPTTTLVDLTFAASRMGVSDTRSADYLVQGFNGGVVTLDASNNTTDTVTLAGILPDASGEVTVDVRAAPSNDNAGTNYFYLGGVELGLTSSPTTPPLLGFDQPLLHVSRPQGAGLFTTPLTLSESTGAAPALALAAVDDATGTAPTWLSIPGSATVDVPFQVGVDAGPLPLGEYSATLTAQAAGYPDATLTVRLSVRDPGARNLLFYGNSYSQGNLGMPSLAGFIAEEAGQPAPNVVAMLVGGQDLEFHLTDPVQAAAITDALPLGEEWDFVVMQGFSLEATTLLGDPQGFRDDALAILTNVRAHSPNAGGVMFQTWARGPGSTFYPGTYPGPLQMHEDIRTNYRLAVADQNAAFGPDTSFVAAAGDCVWLRAFDPLLYTSDWSHPTPPTTLLTAMTVYQAIWRGRTCDVQPDFTGTSNLIQRLGSLGLGEDDWNDLAGIAERVADPELRRYPGSSEDLLLETGINAAPSACPLESAGIGAHLLADLTSPNGLYAGAPAFLLLDGFTTGSPPGMLTPWPEIHLSPVSTLVVASAAALGGGLSVNLVVPTAAPGLSVLLQGVALDESTQTGNALFTATDGHEVVLQ